MIQKTTTELTAKMPYEKFLQKGAEALTEAELLAIILRTGTKNCNAVETAEKVLSLCQNGKGQLNGLHHLSLQELTKVPGIGEVKAVKLKCIAELSVRMAREKAAETLSFQLPQTVAAYYMETLRHEEKEKILLLLLDNKLCLIEEAVISVGTVNASLLSSRDVFQKALRCGACRVMLLHNHPSGDPKPSKQDIMITRKIKEAGEMLDIPLVDHIIVGDRSYISLKEEELL